jgi:hypothetical protein
VPAPQRRPRYPRFLLTGGLVGLLVDVAVLLGPGAGVARRGQLFVYLGVLLIGLGGLLGGLLAVLVEGRGSDEARRAPSTGGPDATPRGPDRAGPGPGDGDP